MLGTQCLIPALAFSENWLNFLTRICISTKIHSDSDAFLSLKLMNLYFTLNNPRKDLIH